MLGFLDYHPLVHVKIGPLTISPHGVGIAVGFLCGARLMLPEANRKGIRDDQVYSLLTRAAIGAIVGARLAYVINHASAYSSPLEIFKVWHGGISLLGGFAGAILLALPKMRSERLSFWKVMDAAAPGMALGVIIGRIGDLIVADHLGKRTSFFLGYKCPPLSVNTASPCNGTGLQTGNIPGIVVHQTALYDFVSTIFLLLFLLWLRRRREWYDGFLIFVFGAWYGAMRIVEDFLREDVRHLGLTGSQWSSIVLVGVCLWLLLFYRRTPRVGQWDKLPLRDGPGEPGAEGEEEAGEERAVPPAPLGAQQSSGAQQSPEAEQPTLSPPEPHQEE
ncbi:MAG: prolipoprotein diacylglyceryl transferase [Acidimicrobiia bacterium]|nr:prolipoprotein diacylglyceryl transferase [Acidimicrobiia bacterium]